MLIAIGEFRALGVSPFGVDSVEPGSLGETVLVDGYRQAQALSSLLVGHPERHCHAVMVDPTGRPVAMTFDELTLTVAASAFPDLSDESIGYVAVVETEPGIFMMIGRGVSITASHTDGHRVGILAVTELEFDGCWRVGGRLNGDETGSGVAIQIPPRVPAFQDLPIPLCTTSTGMLRAEFYRY